MTNSKFTKRAAVLSALTVLMCMVMLAGTTFAWFTDSVSTGVNRIQAGNLSVDLQVFDSAQNKWVSAENKTLDFIKAEGAQNEEVLWEPGATYRLPDIRIVNKGNLAVKYKIVITGAKDANPDNGKDDLKLLEVIDWTYSIEGSGGDATAALDTERHLAANIGTDVYDTLTISGKMRPEAGNEYQGLAVEGIAITVYAAQDTVESDSFDNQYDKDASYDEPGKIKVYPVSSYDEMKKAFDEGGGIILNGYVEGDAKKTAASDRLTIKSPATIDFNGTYYVPGSLEASSNWAAFFINADTVINAQDGCGVACLNKVSGSYLGGPYVANICGDNITVTVNGGSYGAGGTVFNVEKGTLIINGGFFHVWPDIDTNDYRYTLNCIDANYKNGTANIIVKGGTFVNFDPSNNLAEGENTNFVAPGYKVVSQVQPDGDIYYTVVKE